MSIDNFLKTQEPARQELLSTIHNIITKADKTVIPELGSMMGKEMIIYKASNFFKYGLAAVKNHMSLHLMPIYCNQPLHKKYENLLNKAKFQKGCVNFKNAEEMPLAIVKQLMEDCAKIDLLPFLQKEKQSRNKKPAA